MYPVQEKYLSKVGYSLLVALAITVAVASVALAFWYSDQVPLDLFSFRQAQTAISAYWMAHDGFNIAYETPVAGAPWAIPFEFPIFQGLVALIARTTGWNLDSIGRVTSFVFLLLCLWPVRAIVARLRLPNAVFLAFTALFLSSPLYLYWGRAFMIETAALWFTVMSVRYFIDIAFDRSTASRSLLFVLFSCLALLQKVTTGLPVLFFLAVVYGVAQLREARTLRAMVTTRRMVEIFFYFGVSVIVAVAWVLYTDRVRAENSLGVMLLSSKITKWNWGTLDQRLSWGLIQTVFLQRVLPSMGSFLGIVLLTLPFVLGSTPKVKRVVLASVLCGVAPVYIFTNLHLVHEYYQTAIEIFFVFGVAVVLGSAVLTRFGQTVFLILTFALVVWNLRVFTTRYLPVIQQSFTGASWDVAIGRALQREIPEGGQFVAFGNDWSSSFAYLAERKAFTVPPWFRPLERVLDDPQVFLDPGRFSGLVWCPNNYVNPGEILRVAQEKNWKIGYVSACLVAVPERTAPAFPVNASSCDGSIDEFSVISVGSRAALSIRGWTSDPEKRLTDGRVFVRLDDKRGNTMVVEAVRGARPDIGAKVSVPDANDPGFSRLIQPVPPYGQYTVTVLRDFGPHGPVCEIRKVFELPAQERR